jgi:hypothetical protein
MASLLTMAVLASSLFTSLSSLHARTPSISDLMTEQIAPMYSTVCALENANIVDSTVASVYAGSSGHGFNTSALPINRTESWMLQAWDSLCVNSLFASDVTTDGPQNLSMGLEFDWKHGQGNGSYSVSAAMNGSLVESTWSVNLVSGVLSGPHITSSPLSSTGPLLPPAPLGPETLLSDARTWLIIGAIAALAASAVFVLYRRSKSAPPA